MYSSPLYNDERERERSKSEKKFMHRITLLNINFTLNIIKNASPVNCIRHKVVSIGWMLPTCIYYEYMLGGCVYAVLFLWLDDD